MSALSIYEAGEEDDSNNTHNHTCPDSYNEYNTVDGVVRAYSVCSVEDEVRCRILVGEEEHILLHCTLIRICSDAEEAVIAPFGTPAI